MALSLSFKYLIQLTILKEICHACVAIYSAKLYVTKKNTIRNWILIYPWHTGKEVKTYEIEYTKLETVSSHLNISQYLFHVIFWKERIETAQSFKYIHQTKRIKFVSSCGIFTYVTLYFFPTIS